MNTAAIRTALARRLEQWEPARVVYATVPDTVVTPSVCVLPADPFVTHHVTMSGTRGHINRLEFDVIVFAGRFDSASGQGVLDDAIDQLPALIESDQTLEGHADAVVVRETTNYGTVTVAGTQLLGVRIAAEVYAR